MPISSTTPLLIVSQNECALGSKLNASNQADQRNDKILFPSYLAPTRVASNQWRLARLDDAKIRYDCKELAYASYEIKNKITERITAVKRLTVENIFHIWAGKVQPNTPYKGKRGFELMIKDLCQEYQSNVNVELILEDYDVCIFDQSENCVWHPFRINYSKKLDKTGRPLYVMMNFQRHSVHPVAFQKAMDDIQRKYNITIKRFTNAKSVYAYFINELMFGQPSGENAQEPRIIPNDYVDTLSSLLSFFNQREIMLLLQRFESVWGVLNAIVAASDPEFLGFDIPNEKFQRVKQLLVTSVPQNIPIEDT